MEEKKEVSEQTEQDTSRNTREQGRSWFFTYNNYTEKDVEELRAFVQSKQTKKAVQFGWGREISGSGTPHLQGWIYFPSEIKFTALHKRFPRIHWEITKNLAAAKQYCKKDGDYVENIKKGKHHEEQYNKQMIEIYSNITWHKWQEDILKMINEKPSWRQLYWFWEPTGNKGKSFLAKYLDWKYDAIIANGKQSDVFHQYRFYLDTKDKQPTVAIVDIPRSHKDFVCYSTLEKIKDGLAYSGKYEGAKLRLCFHHLIIFANFEPDMYKLSEDRWIIKEID